MPKTSELLLHDFIASLVDPAIILLNNQGSILSWNEGAERLKGYKAAEIIGQHFSCFYTDEDKQADKPQRVLEEALDRGQFVDTGWRVRKDKSRFLAHTTITPLQDIEGKLCGFAKSTRDITDQKAFENALTKSVQEEQIYRLLLKSVIDYAIIVLDTEGNVQTWNEGAQRILGYRAEEILGRSSAKFYTPADIEDGKPQLQLSQARQYGRFEGMGLRIRKNGIYYFAEMTITPLRDDNGQITGFAEVSRDITEKKIIENALLESQQRLQIMNLELGVARDHAETASQSKSEFVAHMSHEMRTPMNGIIGMCNVLLSTSLDASQVHFASSIKEACNSLLKLINDVLDFSKIEAGQIDLQKVDFDPVSVIESVCEILAPMARQKELSLLSFISPAVPKTVQGDPERLRQVILNLVSNAIKFTKHGEIVVKVEIDSRIDNIINLRFSVADMGIGIDEEVQLRLFQPFIQADGSISKQYGGTGLGLSISKHLVELMGGHIGVKSKAGSGSTFWLSLPFKHDSNVSMERKAELKDVRILIVDDEPYAREILNSYCNYFQMKVDTASSADEGLELMKEAISDDKHYEIAIIDLSMPDKNGMAMAREILDKPSLRDTRLILLTAFDTPGLGTQAIELGFKGYITKPVRQNQIQSCLIEVIAGHRTLSGKQASCNPLGQIKRADMRAEQILVVEDHNLNQQVARLYLEAMGFNCEIASDGEEAVLKASEIDFDLILMDCQMPKMDGLTATQQIRKNEANYGRQVPIIAMTASALQGDRDRCLAAGMSDYLSKPIEVAPLHRIMEKWLPYCDQSSVKDKSFPSTRPSSDSLNFDLLNEHYSGYVTALIVMFRESVPPQLKKFKNALSERNQTSVLQVAHGLKGLCLTVFASHMSEICAQIEIAGQNNNWPALNILVDSLFEEFKKVENIAQSSQASRSHEQD